MNGHRGVGDGFVMNPRARGGKFRTAESFHLYCGIESPERADHLRGVFVAADFRDADKDSASPAHLRRE